MPIYEYKCLKCKKYFESLVISKDDLDKIKCPDCGSTIFEQIMSVTNYSTDNVPGTSNKVSAKTRNCSTGTCTTYDIPGPSR